MNKKTNLEKLSRLQQDLKILEFEKVILAKEHELQMTEIENKISRLTDKIANKRKFVKDTWGITGHEKEVENILYNQREFLASLSHPEQITIFLIREVYFAKHGDEDPFGLTGYEGRYRQEALSEQSKLLKYDGNYIQVSFLYLEVLIRELLVHQTHRNPDDVNININKEILDWQKSCGLQPTRKNKPRTTKSRGNGNIDVFFTDNQKETLPQVVRINYIKFLINELEEALKNHLVRILTKLN